MWDKQPTGKTTCAECPFQGGCAHVQRLPSVRQCPGHDTPPTPTDASEAALPPPRQGVLGSAAGTGCRPPHEASHLLPTRQKPSPEPPLHRRRTAIPQWAVPLWLGPSRHAPPLTAWPLGSPHPSVPRAAGAAAAVMAASAGLGGAAASTGSAAPALPAVPPHRRLRPPRLYVPPRQSVGPRQAAGRGRRRRRPAIADPVLRPAISSHPPFNPQWALLSSSYHVSFTLSTPFSFQAAQKKQQAAGNWEKEQANKEPGQTVPKVKKPSQGTKYSDNSHFLLTPRVLAAFLTSVFLTFNCPPSTTADRCYPAAAGSPDPYLSLNE